VESRLRTPRAERPANHPVWILAVRPKVGSDASACEAKRLVMVVCAAVEHRRLPAARRAAAA
jgi:hypothetical protein